MQDLQLWSSPVPEAQVAAMADDIAYDAHDIDDGLRAGLFTPRRAAAVPLIGGDRARHPRCAIPALEPARLVHELVRRLIDRHGRGRDC